MTTKRPEPSTAEFTPTYEFEVDRVWRCKDGDTIVAEILLPFGMSITKAEIRFLDIDTWESHRRKGRSAEHVRLGKEATNFLIKLLHNQPAHRRHDCTLDHDQFFDRDQIMAIEEAHLCICTSARPWRRKWVRSYKNGKYKGHFGRYLFEMYLESASGETYSVADYLRANGYEKRRGV